MDAVATWRSCCVARVEVIAMATQAQYPSGTTVRLTAQAGEGYVFKDWSGDQASKENPIQLIIQMYGFKYLFTIYI